MRAQRRGRSVGAVIATVSIATALIAAACTSSTDVRVEESSDFVQGRSAPGERSVPDPVGPAGTVEAPDASGLPALDGGDPATITGTLDNGLRYLVRSNDNPGGKVELRLVVDAGSGVEDADQVGAAHFVEHMLFNGTERFPENELVDELRGFGAAFGADINARTNFDETVYTLNVPDEPEAIGTALDILGEWLSAATLSPADVEAERGIVLDEWRARVQTSNGRIFDRLANFLLADTPYEGHLPIGTRASIETITPEALTRFYDDWYRPDNAGLIVVGDIDVDDIEAEIERRFADLEPRSATRERVDLDVDPANRTRVEIVADADLAEGAVSVILPTAVEVTSLEADQQRSILDRLVFDIVETRLDNDALRGDAPYERASAGSSSIVRPLSAPRIDVEVDGAGVEDSLRAVVDEFERVARFGVTPAELDRAIASRRARAERAFDGRNSRQDSSFAEEYTRHLLEGEWYVPAEREFDFVNAVLDRATVETAAFGIVERLRSSGVHVFVRVPAAEADDVADEAVLIDIVDGADERELDPRPDEDPDDDMVGDTLMRAPEPVDEVERAEMVTDPFTPALDPMVLRFANGARVALNTTSIVENEVFFSARSPGGLDFVSDSAVADGQALGSVISDSGVGDFDRVQIATFLDDRSVSFAPEMTPLTNEMSGRAATPDLEVLFQLVHLMMTDPRADDTAVERYVDDRLPFANDPSIDAGYAARDALTRSRYDDQRFLLPTPESLATVDAAGIEAVARQAFALESRPWSFAFSGDFDIDEVTDLARRYIGSIPDDSRSTGTAEPVEPPPPEGVVVTTAEGGQGATAQVLFLFTGEASAQRRDDVVASVVREIVANRLTDVIREELGDSYSPSARLEIGTGDRPSTEMTVTVSTAPESVEEVSAAVTEQLDLLVDDGPSDREFSNAVNTVDEQLNFIDNAQINREVLAVLTDPEGNASFDEFVEQARIIDTVTPGEVRNALAAFIDLDQYIEVRITPRA